MFQNNTYNKKQTLKNFDDSMKLLLTESIKFFPVSSINRIRRRYKALNILRKDGSLKYFMNGYYPMIIRHAGLQKRLKWCIRKQENVDKEILLLMGGGPEMIIFVMMIEFYY